MSRHLKVVKSVDQIFVATPKDGVDWFDSVERSIFSLNYIALAAALPAVWLKSQCPKGTVLGKYSKFFMDDRSESGWKPGLISSDYHRCVDLVLATLPGTQWMIGESADGPFCHLQVPAFDGGWLEYRSVEDTVPLAVLKAMFQGLEAKAAGQVRSIPAFSEVLNTTVHGWSVSVYREDGTGLYQWRKSPLPWKRGHKKELGAHGFDNEDAALHDAKAQLGRGGSV